MSNAAWIVLFLGVVGVCVVALTVTVVITAAEFRRTLRDTRAFLQHARRLLAKADRPLAAVEVVVQQICAAVTDTINQITRLRRRAQAFWVGHVGNGAGVDPRSHHRVGRE